MNANKTREWAGPTLTPYTDIGKDLMLPGPALVELVRDVLSRGRFFRFSAPGVSMAPFIRNGDVITLAPCRPETLAIGDVMAFRQPGTDRLVVHRLVRITVDGLRTRGDSCLEDDAPIPPEAVLAVVTRVERNGRAILVGLGPERRAIALLSRRGLLPVLVHAGTTAKELIGSAHD